MLTLTQYNHVVTVLKLKYFLVFLSYCVSVNCYKILDSGMGLGGGTDHVTRTLRLPGFTGLGGHTESDQCQYIW